MAKTANSGSFKVGHPGPSKSRKGVPNKDKETVAATCERMGLNVAEAMIHLATTTEDENIKCSMLKELASYLYAKMKHVEVSGSLGIDTSRQDEELVKLREQVKERIKERK